MKKSEKFWNMFWETGKIEPYLHYKLIKEKEKQTKLKKNKKGR